MMSATLPDRQKKEPGVLLGLGLAFELGYLIALPAVALGFLGAYLDRRFETSPLFILVGFILAFAISAYAVWKKVREIVHAQYGETPKIFSSKK